VIKRTVFAIIFGWFAFWIVFVLVRTPYESVIESLPIPMIFGPLAGLVLWTVWPLVERHMKDRFPRREATDDAGADVVRTIGQSLSMFKTRCWA